MIVDIPSEYRKIEKINASYKFLYVSNMSSSYLYGKKSETEYYYSMYIPSGRKIRIDIEKMIKEFPECKYHAFMYDSRVMFNVFYYTNNDENDIDLFDFVEVK